MDVVLFTVATGATYARMAGLMAGSARRLGRFDGRIIVFTDLRDPPSTLAHEGPAIEWRPLPAEAAKVHPYMRRAVAVNWLPSHEGAIYADADVLFLRPLEPLLLLLPADGLAGFGEGQSLVRNVPCFNNAMTNQELAAYGSHRGMNSGFLMGRRPAWQRTVPLWVDGFSTRRRRGSRQCYDQPVLNALAAAGDVVLHFLPDEFVGYPNVRAVRHPPGPTCIAEHYAGRKTLEQISRRFATLCRTASTSECPVRLH